MMLSCTQRSVKQLSRKKLPSKLRSHLQQNKKDDGSGDVGGDDDDDYYYYQKKLYKSYIVTYYISTRDNKKNKPQKNITEKK